MKKMLLFVIAYCLPIFLYAQQAGEALEKQMWEDMRAGNWDSVEAHIAPYFQSIHLDGPRTKEQEIALIKKLNLGNYVISDMRVTQNQDVTVVTYRVAVSETVGGKRSQPNPTPRLSVWKNVNGTWKWVAHANLNP